MGTDPTLVAWMRSNLSDSGLLIFDVNSRSTYMGDYCEIRKVESERSRWVWTGRGEVAPAVFEAEIAGDGLKPIRHLERFRPEDEVVLAMEGAGLRPVAAMGMREVEGKIVLSASVGEERDYKLVFIGARTEIPPGA